MSSLTFTINVPLFKEMYYRLNVFCYSLLKSKKVKK